MVRGTTEHPAVEDRSFLECQRQVVSFLDAVGGDLGLRHIVPNAKCVAGQATIATCVDWFIGTAVAGALEPGNSSSIGGIPVPGFESKSVVEAVDSFEECVALEVGQDSPPTAHAETTFPLPACMDGSFLNADS